ncbi:hypothetical protein LEP1GSC041_3011 [Leptospira noguchii str. 2006001870]|nr:hypothetical protein LEP1GSC041_3011 [Leptospira noguchii str. 2006001870]EMI70441.1 hypothetical protein LEP1GSC072_3490 [Leptospira noguchii str. Bonito]
MQPDFIFIRNSSSRLDQCVPDIVIEIVTRDIVKKSNLWNSAVFQNYNVLELLKIP